MLPICWWRDERLGRIRHVSFGLYWCRKLFGVTIQVCNGFCFSHVLSWGKNMGYVCEKVDFGLFIQISKRKKTHWSSKKKKKRKVMGKMSIMYIKLQSVSWEWDCFFIFLRSSSTFPSTPLGGAVWRVSTMVGSSMGRPPSRNGEVSMGSLILEAGLRTESSWWTRQMAER